MLFPSCTVSPPETACRGRVAGLEQPAEPGPGGGDSILSFWQPGLLCCGPKEGRSIQSPVISTLDFSPSFCLREGRKLFWGSTYPLLAPSHFPSVTGSNPVASSSLSVLTPPGFWLLFTTQTRRVRSLPSTRAVLMRAIPISALIHLPL